MPILDDINFSPSTCSTCTFWLPDDDGTMGYCRRHSPLPFSDSSVRGALWPLTQDSDYCGDHELKPPSA